MVRMPSNISPWSCAQASQVNHATNATQPKSDMFSMDQHSPLCQAPRLAGDKGRKWRTAEQLGAAAAWPCH